MIALHAQKVPSSVCFCFFAIVAGNVHHSSKFGWHRLQSYTSRHGVPGWEHSLTCLCRLFADWTAAIVCGELSKAVPMNGVSTGHFMARRSTAEQVFLAHRTVGSVLSCLAIVVAVERLVNAHTAVMAVLKILRPSDSTKAAVGAVIGCLLVAHP
jgi:hypothetical protein